MATYKLKLTFSDNTEVTTTNAIEIPNVAAVSKADHNDSNTSLNGITIGDTTYKVPVEGGHSGVGSLALGTSSTTGSYNSSTAIGYATYCGGNSAIAVGYNANASAQAGTVIGATASASGQYGTAIGASAKARYQYAIGIGYNVSGPTNAGYTHIGYNYTSTGRGLALGVNNSGYCYMNAAGSSWTSASDRRDKTDIEPLRDSLDFINQLQPVTYVMNNRDLYKETVENEDGTTTQTFDEEGYKNETKKKTRRFVGLVAQDLYQTMNEYYGSDNYMDIVDWSGYDHPEELETNEDQYTIQYERLVPVLIKSIQELSSQVNELKAQIEDLKNN